MSYRDDIEALAARQATLRAELGHRQRELAEVTAMLAEARRVAQAETYFARAPDLQRRRRIRLAVAAVVVLAISGGALGVAVGAERARILEETELRVQAPPPQVRSRVPVRISYENLDRMRAQVEALNVLGLIPVIPPQPQSPEDERAQRARDQAVRQAAYGPSPSTAAASTAREDQR